MKKYAALLGVSVLVCSACGGGESGSENGDLAASGGFVGAFPPVGAGAAFPIGAGGQVAYGAGGSYVAPGAGGGVPLPGAGGQPDPGGTGGAVPGAGGDTSSGGAGPGGAPSELPHFSFFAASQKAMLRLASQANPASQVGFGGDLRYGETGDGAGLRGADKICTEIAEGSMPGAGAKQWRAFLSTSTVDAIDRVGAGPWYDRLGRVLAMNITDLGQKRPVGADPAIIDDFPNEDGVPNQNPDLTGAVDNHDFLTGSNAQGRYYGSLGSTCNDWTSAVGSTGKPRVGHSWPRDGIPGFPGGGPGGPGGGNIDMAHWISALDEAGCAPGVNIIEMGPPDPSKPTVGSGGGYGGIYCFALTP